MYCPIYVTSINCLVNELLLWTDISSEHPIFIKTVAELTQKNLPKELVDRLMYINKTFSDLNAKVKNFKMKSKPAPQPGSLRELKSLMEEFMLHDNQFLRLLPQVKQYGQNDKVWQTLLNHITHEQRFMLELFTDTVKQM